MWLPTPFYERAPLFWLLLGVLFITAALWVGFDRLLAFIYFGVGCFCVAWGFGIYVMRGKHRRGPYPVRGLHMIQVLDKTQPLNLGTLGEASNDARNTDTDEPAKSGR